MKDSEIYLRAAEEVSAKNQMTCSLLERIGSGDHSYEYADIFRSTPDDWYIWQADLPVGKQRQQWRVLALLFMHEIAKSEGR